MQEPKTFLNTRFTAKNWKFDGRFNCFTYGYHEPSQSKHYGEPAYVLENAATNGSNGVVGLKHTSPPVADDNVDIVDVDVNIGIADVPVKPVNIPDELLYHILLLPTNAELLLIH